ncbi:hypothetical protein GCM10010116_44200 [Microbispora rosea subsp. aerata]|nr:hypothetical protein GCM10010116_44200 [Microbispora rosea subsp. aerata]GIH53813.1 hypothetical protein Mro02_07270 [Microbispora rosea subsp. aerata]GLJ81808.1 hypothetical protein GCM10017588_05330 [Microbispora rosea subsp. aerata]
MPSAVPTPRAMFTMPPAAADTRSGTEAMTAVLPAGANTPTPVPVSADAVGAARLPQQSMPPAPSPARPKPVRSRPVRPGPVRPGPVRPEPGHPARRPGPPRDTAGGAVRGLPGAAM